MIVFQTEHLELYNHIVHIFLKKEIFNDNANIEHITDMYIGDMIEGLMLNDIALWVNHLGSFQLFLASSVSFVFCWFYLSFYLSHHSLTCLMM